MRFYLVTLSALTASLICASAQITVQLVTDQDKFLPAEEMLIGVRIVNRSGQTLRLGDDADWVKYSIEKVGGGVVHQVSDPPVQGGFDLDSGSRATMKVNLAACYQMRQAGRYLITARVKVKEWNETFVTRPLPVEILEGTKLWEQVVGVPRPGTGQPPESRTYTLQQANYLKSQLRLYLRVSASDGEVIKLIRVGRMISFGQPEPQVDRNSRLHLLYQNAAKTFEYLVVSPNGEIKVRQLYEYTNTRPRLSLDGDGEITVKGGARRKTAEDIPATVDKQDDAQEKKP